MNFNELLINTRVITVQKLLKNKPIFQSAHVPYVYKIVDANNASLHLKSRGLLKRDLDIFNGKRVFAFLGIARNDDFRKTVESFKCKVTGFSGFPDHHQYSDRELGEIVNQQWIYQLILFLPQKKIMSELLIK